MSQHAPDGPTLRHERIAGGSAAGGPWLVFLHGVYGAGRNWSTVARRLLAERPGWNALLVDLRQHGGSRGFPPPHTLAAAAEDLRLLVASAGSPPGQPLPVRVLVAHSFGGKVALVYARQPATPLQQLWVVDSTPSAGPPRGSAWEMLAVLRAHRGPFASRDEGVAALHSGGVAPAVASWMATNLEGSPSEYRWRIDPDDMEALLRDFFATDAWDVIEEPPEGLAVHVVKATESSILDEAACARIEAAARRTGRVFLHRVEGGHWLNADNPGALVALLAAQLG